MISFEEYIMLEMARPASSFADVDMNTAYSNALKAFKQMGIDNANTYIIWDFMFRQLPEFFKTPEILEARKKASGTNQRKFVLDLVKRHPQQVDLLQWARDINDETKIRAYIDRPDKGNRHFGRVRADAQQFIDTLPRKR